MKNIFYKKEKGITLIALVITIIVLLLLAGVAISMLSGENGILKQAQTAKKATGDSEFEEEVKLAVVASKTNETGRINKDELDKELKKINGAIISKGTDDGFPWIVSKENNAYKIDDDETVTKINGIYLSKSNLELALGEEMTITATLLEGVTGTIIWESSDSNIVTVNDGTIIASDSVTGTAIITAKIDGTDYEATCTVTVAKKLAIGDYIEYDVAYTDMYYSSNTYTTTNGWRLLSYTDNGNGTYSNVQLISTGVPAKFYYCYNQGNNEWYVPDETDETTGVNLLDEFKNILQPEGTNYVFYTGSSKYYSLQAAAGLYYNFGETIYRYGTSSSEYNQGYFTSITNGSTTYDSNYSTTDGENIVRASKLFLTEKAESVRLLTLTEINTALNRTETIENEDGTTSTVIDVDSMNTITDSTGLYKLNSLTSVPGMESFTKYSSGYYWLASPCPTVANEGASLCIVLCGGGVNHGSNLSGFGPVGVRPTVTLKSNVQFELSEDGNYWEIVEVK